MALDVAGEMAYNQSYPFAQATTGVIVRGDVTRTNSSVGGTHTARPVSSEPLCLTYLGGVLVMGSNVIAWPASRYVVIS